MPEPLDNPVEVVDGISRATCTLVLFGATLQGWSDPPVISYCVLGAEGPDGRFVPATGLRADTGTPATQYAHWTPDDYAWYRAQPAVQEAIALLAERHAEILARSA